MALAKKRHIEQAKVRVREKLEAIEQQRDSIMQYVDGQLNQAKESATSLLQLTDRAQFMHSFRPIMQQLEECLNTLFMIQASLPVDDTETSGDESSDIDALEDTLTPGGEAVNETCSVASACAASDISREKHISCDTQEMNIPVTPECTDELDISQSAKPASELTSDLTKVADIDTVSHAKDSVKTPCIPELAQTTDVVIDNTPQQTDSISTDVSTATHKVAAPGGVLGSWRDRRLKVPTLTLYEDANLDVFVTEVVNPSLFWIQPLSSKLEEMMAELIVYHSKLQPTDAGYHLASRPTPGMLVCACFTRDDNWYRARIIAVHVDSSTGSAWEVDVLYIDYGNRERTTLDRIRPMPANFTKLPCHAFTCALAEIAPPDGSTTWQTDQSIEFAQMVLNGKMLYASFLPPGGDSVVYFVELYHLNPSQAAGMSLMNSVSELLIQERKARKAGREVVIQVLTDSISQDAPPDGAIPETLVHRLQTPEFVFHRAANENRKMLSVTADDGGVTSTAAKKALAKEKERNRAVRESLRKRKEARHSSENAIVKKTVSPPGVASASVSVASGDDMFSEVMGSSADRLQDDFAVAAEGTTSTPVTAAHQGASLDCTKPQSEKQTKNSSTQMDSELLEEECVLPTWRTWSSPEPPGGKSVAWLAYYRNNTIVVRQGERCHSVSDQKSDDGCTDEQDCEYSHGNQRDEQMPETRSEVQDNGYNNGSRSKGFGQRRDEQRSEIHKEGQDSGYNRGSRSEGFGQRRDEQRSETRRNDQDSGYNGGYHSEGFGQQRDEQRPKTCREGQDSGCNRGNRSDGFGQRRYEQRPHSDGQDSGYNRGNHSEEFGQRKDEKMSETCREVQDRGYNRGNCSEGFGQERDEQRHETRRDGQNGGYNHGSHSYEFGQRRHDQRCDSWRDSSEHADCGTRNDLECLRSNEQSRRRARSEYQPCSPEYQSNATRYSSSGFNRNRFDMKRDSGFGNRSGFDSSESRNGNRRSNRSGAHISLGTNNWDFFDDDCRSSPRKNRSSFESENWQETRKHQDSPRTSKVNTTSAVDEEVWDLEPASETTTDNRTVCEQKEARNERHDTSTKTEKALWTSDKRETTMNGNDDPKGTAQRSPEIKLVDEITTTGKHVTHEKMASTNTTACAPHNLTDSTENHPPESVSQRQKLKERGLPNRLPKSCGFSRKYKQWMAGGDGETAPGEGGESKKAGDGVRRQEKDIIDVGQGEEVVGTSERGGEETAEERRQEETTGELEGADRWTSAGGSGVEKVTPDETSVKVVNPDESRVKKVTSYESRVEKVTPDDSGVEMVTPDESGMETVTPDESGVKTVTPDESRIETVTPDESGVETVTPDELWVKTVISDESGVETVTPHDFGVETVTTDKLGVETVTSGELGVETMTSNELGVETVTPDELGVETMTSDESRVETVTPDESRMETVTADQLGAENVETKVTTNESGVVMVTPVQLALEGATPGESGEEALIISESGVETVNPDKSGMETAIPNKLGMQTVIPDKSGVKMVIPVKTGVEALTTSVSGLEPEGIKRVAVDGSACCEDAVVGEGLDMKSHGDDIAEEYKGSHEENTKKGNDGSGKGIVGSTRPVGETDTVGDLGETAVPQGDVVAKDEPEKTRAGHGTENLKEESNSVLSGKDGVTVGVDKGLDKDLSEVVTGETTGTREVEESGNNRNDNGDIFGQGEAAADKFTDHKVNEDTTTGAENVELQTLSLTLLDVSNADNSAHVEVGQLLLTSPPGESMERVYNPPEITVGDDGNIGFMMSYIESPSCFWVHLVTENASSAIESLMHDLNQYYKTANKVMLKKFFEGEDTLNLNNICCAQFSEDNDFYRIEIVSKRFEVEEISPGVANSVKESGDTCRQENQSRRLAKVKVFYIDFGNSEWLSPKRIYPLPPLFATLAPQAVCCHLVALEPLILVGSRAGGEGVKDDTLDGHLVKWCPEATQKFIELTGFDKKLFAYVTDKEEILRPTNSRPLDVVVVDTSQNEDVWINDELVRLGLAKFSGPVTAIQSQLYNVSDDKATKEATGASDLPADWNPLAEDYLSERNSYFVDVDDPGVATVGIKAEDELTICHFYNTPSGCWKGHNCRFEHIRTTDAVTNQRRAVYLRNDLESMLSPPKQDSWVAVELTAIFSPSHFYVTFPFGTRPAIELMQELASDEGYEGSNDTFKSEMLEQLMENLNEHYNQQGGFRDTDMTIYASGELVVARFSDDSRWYRAKVVDTDPDVTLVKVFYVDFGNAEWLPEACLAQIQPQFLHLPFQAMECFLPLVAATDDGSWSSEARNCFTELAEGKVLFAHVLSTNSNNVISVELYDTELEEDVDIGQVLIDTGFAKQPDRTTFKRPLSPTSKHTATHKPRYVPG